MRNIIIKYYYCYYYYDDDEWPVKLFTNMKETNRPRQKQLIIPTPPPFPSVLALYREGGGGDDFSF